jgi:hypothetical protein
MSPVGYELGFYIPEDGILHNHCRENLAAYTNPFFIEYTDGLRAESPGLYSRLWQEISLCGAHSPLHSRQC